LKIVHGVDFCFFNRGTGKMDGWMDMKAVLRIAYSNKNNVLLPKWRK
jgi:hypothetical protein